jgi:cytochrome c oxidase subunit 2
MSHLFSVVVFYINRFYLAVKALNVSISASNKLVGIWILALSTWLCITTASASEKLSVTGQQTLQQCDSCHGSDLNGNIALNSPALAGQSAQYMAEQISKFQQGLRGSHDEDVAGQQMVEIAKSLNNEAAFTEVLRYLSELPVAQKTTIFRSDINLKQGNNYYQGKCGACHGINAQGNDLLHAPRLNNLSTEYLTTQMANFTRGIRGTDAKDKYGRQMALMAKTSTGSELVNIIAFIQSQGRDNAAK